MTIHTLKCDPVWFQRSLDGTKTFEVRRNDRGFQRGDQVRLREYTIFGYTGREATFWVGDVFSGGQYGCNLNGFVVFSLLKDQPE